MNRDWNSIMFDNIGTKIKMVAKVTAWVQILQQPIDRIRGLVEQAAKGQ